MNIHKYFEILENSIDEINTLHQNRFTLLLDNNSNIKPEFFIRLLH